MATLAFGLIGSVAAIVVVPEVRCAMGLEEGKTLRDWKCASAELSGSRVLGLGFLPLPPPGAIKTRAASAANPPNPAAIDRIAAQYRYIEARRESMASWQQPMEGSGASEAYANVWSENGSIRLIRARFHKDGYRKALLFYYTDGELVFVHQVVKRIGSGDDGPTLDEQRFYFDGGRLIRWLDVTRAGISGGASEFAENERRLGEIARKLLRAADPSGAPIRL